MDYLNEYNRWIDNVFDDELKSELKTMTNTGIEDAFYRKLSFGTGGLRGIIGAGTNRMNIYTVAAASQGLADYLKSESCGKKTSVVIGHDSRIKSDIFAKVAADVFLANGIDVFFWKELLPVPLVSYAVRELKASVGIMITASHNPAQYNGYKVYGYDGCQITTEAASAIYAHIKEVDIFRDVKGIESKISVSLKKENSESILTKSVPSKRINAVEPDMKGTFRFIDESVLTSYINTVKMQSVLFNDSIDKDVAIVYSPLNGTGLKPVTRVLEESGFSNISIVEEQRLPDGNFPTCQYPNPEVREAMSLGLDYCKRIGADILLATDPDCDRCGIAVKVPKKDEYRLLSGNEVGLLLLEFICRQRIKHGKMPKHPIFVKTIVTTDLAEKIALHYGVETINVLTGFKFIGEVIGKLQSEARESDYICGFEESYGYLTGTYVRDKDAVNAAFMICEMFAYYNTRGISLVEKLEQIYDEYGYCLNTLHSYEFGGSAGMQRMSDIMTSVRQEFPKLGDEQVEEVFDYINGRDELPNSDVIKFVSKSASVVIRPSGTEPKLKVYVAVVDKDKKNAMEREKDIVKKIEDRIGL